MADRAMRRALLGYHDRLAHATKESPWLRKFPIVVVVRATDGPLTFEPDLIRFGRIVADTETFYVMSGEETPIAHDFSGRPKPDAANALHPVALLQVGDAVSACRLDATESQLLMFERSQAERSLRIFDQGNFAPLAPAATIATGETYSRGMSAWQHYLAWIYNPSLGSSGLSAIVNLSRETGIMVAATSYIAVENSAQWKMLELKERQKLANQNALDFEQIPEPSTSLLLLIGGLIFVYARRSKTLGRP